MFPSHRAAIGALASSMMLQGRALAAVLNEPTPASQQTNQMTPDEMKEATRPRSRAERRRSWFDRPQQQPIIMRKHIGPSKYMPHIGAKQRAKGLRLSAT